jgi:hypothetical protein
MGPLLLIVPLALLLPAKVDVGETGLLKNARGRHVYVIDHQSREWRGTLLDVAQETIVLDIQSTSRQFNLSQITRVDAEGDSIKDGVIKGALFGALLGALSGQSGKSAAWGSLTWAVLGLGLDALHSHKNVVYKAPGPSVTVKW